MPDEKRRKDVNEQNDLVENKQNTHTEKKGNEEGSNQLNSSNPNDYKGDFNETFKEARNNIWNDEVGGVPGFRKDQLIDKFVESLDKLLNSDSPKAIRKFNVETNRNIERFLGFSAKSIGLSIVGMAVGFAVGGPAAWFAGLLQVLEALRRLEKNKIVPKRAIKNSIKYGTQALECKKNADLAREIVLEAIAQIEKNISKAQTANDWKESRRAIQNAEGNIKTAVEYLNLLKENIKNFKIYQKELDDNIEFARNRDEEDKLIEKKREAELTIKELEKEIRKHGQKALSAIDNGNYILFDDLVKEMNSLSDELRRERENADELAKMEKDASIFGIIDKESDKMQSDVALIPIHLLEKDSKEIDANINELEKVIEKEKALLRSREEAIEKEKVEEDISEDWNNEEVTSANIVKNKGQKENINQDSQKFNTDQEQGLKADTHQKKIENKQLDTTNKEQKQQNNENENEYKLKEKPEQKAKGKPEEKPNEKPEQKAKGKPEEKPNEKPEQKAKGKPEEKPNEKPEQKVKKKPEEKPNEKPEQKAKKKPEEKPKEKPEQKAKGKPEEKPNERPEQKAKGKPEEKPNEKPEQKAKKKPEEKPNEKPEQKAKKKPEEKPNEKPEQKAKGKPEEKPNERPEQKAKGKPEEKPNEKPEQKAKKKPEEKPNEKPEEKEKVKPEEKPKAKPKAKAKGESMTTPSRGNSSKDNLSL